MGDRLPCIVVNLNCQSTIELALDQMNSEVQVQKVVRPTDSDEDVKPDVKPDMEEDQELRR